MMMATRSRNLNWVITIWVLYKMMRTSHSMRTTTAATTTTTKYTQHHKPPVILLYQKKHGVRVRSQASCGFIYLCYYYHSYQVCARTKHAHRVRRSPRLTHWHTHTRTVSINSPPSLWYVCVCLIIYNLNYMMGFRVAHLIVC